MLLHCLQLFNSANEIKTTSNELASPTGTLASLCHRVFLSQEYILKKNFSGYHTTGKNASVTAAIVSQ